MTETLSSSPSAANTPPPPDDWVPADERIAGFDRRTIWPGVVLLVVWALWAHVVPWIDDQITVETPIAEGDVINLGGGDLTFLPAVGWNLDSGRLLVEGQEDAVVVPSTAALSSETVAYGVQTGGWDGSAEELVDQMIDVNEGLDLLIAEDEQGRVPIENADGVPGEIVYLVGSDQAALIAAFVFEPDPGNGGGSSPPIGVEIEVRGTPQALEDQVEEIATMIASTTYRPDGQEEGS